MLSAPSKHKQANMTSTEQPQNRYHSYLLRLWFPTTNDNVRIQLECIDTGDRIGFRNLDSLLDYLQTRIGADTVGDRTVL
jgi:hypothetical protein